MRGWRAAVAALAALAPAAAAADAPRPCRLALALALDISASVDAREYAIQIGGLAAALRAPDLREAILSQGGEVWLAVYEWSGWQQQDLIADWAPLRRPADIDALAARLDAHARPYADFSTSIGRALAYGADLFRRLPAVCDRRVIDVSGDGAHNDGVAPAEVRASGALAGITVNALVVAGAVPPPAPHYEREVLHGPGAFLLVARGGFADYPELIRAKLLREIRPPHLLGALR
ncbi:MAG TPA: DUF1194 domain-containing protein [Paracoccaceae bacterium]|nr:DUF1194 domain-containing protein [Paracoccaceae bacterium]